MTEAGVPGIAAITSGRMYAEVNLPINTGIALANPNGDAVTISFNFTDRNGNDFGQSSFPLPAGAQLARFLNEPPFRAPNFAGAFTFNASAPVAVMALRTVVNERGDFLATTQIVTPLPDTAAAGTIVIGHFAVGGGWSTELILLNTTDTSMSGTVQFFNEGTPAIPGLPVALNVNGQTGTSFVYSIRPRSSAKLSTLSSAAAPLQVGSIRVTPDSGSTSPSASAVFSFSQNGVTISRTTIQSQPAGFAFRTYVEVNSIASIPAAIQSGVAIANPSATPATVNFELTDLNGQSTGLTASVFVPASGHVSAFVHQLFPSLTPSLNLPFKGILRITSGSSIEVVSLRMRFNERSDFLITTMPVTNEASPSTTTELIFPQIVDRGGFSTQFILFSGLLSQRTTGMLRFFGADGQPLNLTVR